MKKQTQSGMTLIELAIVLLILVALAGLVVPYMGGTGSKALCDATDLSMQNIKKAIMGGGSGAAFYLDTLGYFPKDKKAGTNYSLRYLIVQPLDSANGGWDNFDPETAVGWRGPYLMTSATLGSALASNLASDAATYDLATDTYTLAGGSPYVHQKFTNPDIVINDAWGRPIVIQVPTVSDCKTILGLTSNPKEGYCARLVSAGPGLGLGIDNADIETTITGNRNSDDRILYLNAPTPVADINPGCDQ